MFPKNSLRSEVGWCHYHLSNCGVLVGFTLKRPDLGIVARVLEL